MYSLVMSPSRDFIKTEIHRLFNPLTRISQFFDVVFMHPKRISQKTCSITHASIKSFLAQEMLVL